MPLSLKKSSKFYKQTIFSYQQNLIRDSGNTMNVMNSFKPILAHSPTGIWNCICMDVHVAE